MLKIRTYLTLMKRAIDILIQGMRYVCAFLLVIMIAITFVQVVMRFCFNAPFSWAEEVTLMVLVWFGYICMSVDIFTDTHAALYFLYNKLPAPLRKGADLFRHGILAWLFVEMVQYGLVITKINAPKPQPATHFSQGLLFAPLVVCGTLMVLFAGLNFLLALATPLSEYRTNLEKTKTIEEINIERGGV
ncbi:TRAP-type C4-dicarboxylate transport system, small permease component [Sphaerochaeta pleomorpha str. Grapes]|uniref:TRAP-type C4-dicarboxylate transport system, small permease component n=1 Tax=Sphaerochaeta pleomorpha (strain ATCC BAA-1885 / DSM 22778 / Grapes) TaxID=158190 RepID=G8QQV3_SPHPG|nr:TRAP transporter small permease [Sphaerochaeta pleomorpha]AEV28734.1 TRAP-type C4-dicarboxylate transport system, small permease component [Sphaerochaeta pleomorpha str. Grapes]